MKNVRLGILISGRGSNMVALAQAGCFDIALVAADQPDAGGLVTARDMGLDIAVVPREQGMGRATHELQMIEQLRDAGVTHVALAGYMRLLSPQFLAAFPAVFNIHPSLLPAYPGLDTHARAIAAGASTHGCTVHLVDAGMDTGPILAQGALSVRAGETASALAARVLRLEHALYATTLQNFFAGQLGSS